MRIISKKQADKMLVESLFKPVNGKTLYPINFSSGKYETKPEIPYIGREVETGEGVHAVYPVRRSDKDGAFIRLMCLVSY